MDKNNEENDAVACLLDEGSSPAHLKRALKRIAEILEECYILNLPASQSIMAGLESFSKKTEVDATLKTRAKNILKQYRL
ncbi:MAG: hypothetical protein AAGC73_04165 [Verrucomicrobiota bacterium]